jgi:DNA polymerase III epsilon subunit-like protein
MINFFDTETTGLPKNWRAPMSDVENWPRIIQLAWTVTDSTGKVLKTHERLIKPDGWEVPTGDFWIQHGFTQEKSMAEGEPLAEVLTEFIADLESCEILVAHNMDFDHKVVGAEMVRHGMTGKVLAKICTKEVSVDFCKIPFPGRKDTRSWVQQQYKWPTLAELHMKLFGKEFENAHSAGGDVLALKDCFFGLVNRGVIELKIEPKTEQNDY